MTRALVERNGEWVPILEHLDTLDVERDSHAKSIQDTLVALKHAVDTELQPISEPLSKTFLALLSFSMCILPVLCDYTQALTHLATPTYRLFTPAVDRCARQSRTRRQTAKGAREIQPSCGRRTASSDPDEDCEIIVRNPGGVYLAPERLQSASRFTSLPSVHRRGDSS